MKRKRCRKRRKNLQKRLDQYCNTMEYIWGVSADGEEQECNLWSINDITVVRWTETGEYSVDVETIYRFDDVNRSAVYLQRLLRLFTEWMQAQGYDTEQQPTLYGTFTVGRNARFKTIEEAYMDFKVRVTGYCTLVQWCEVPAE